MATSPRPAMVSTIIPNRCKCCFERGRLNACKSGAANELPRFSFFNFSLGTIIMKTKALAAILFAGGILIGARSSEIIHAQAPALAIRQVLQTDLNNLPGQEVLLFASTWQPGFRLPL